MKGRLAWLCYERQYSDDVGPDPEDEKKIVFHEPRSFEYSKVVPIVYFELED